MHVTACLIGAILTVALTNVLVGMAPGKVTGDAQLAGWLISLLIGVMTYALLSKN